MGKNNKQRRAAKKRERQRREQATARRRPDRGRQRRTDGRQAAPEDLLRAAAHAWHTDDVSFEAVLEALLTVPDEAATALERAFEHAIDELWRRGWTPVDLVQAATRQLSSDHGDLAAAAAVADGRSRTGRGQELHPRWEAQLEGLEQRCPPDGVVALGWAGLRLGVEVLCLVLRLPGVPPTIPAPGTASATAAGLRDRSAGLDERVLARVRALLAKAESTTFDEEAEALTAKAQELIARHALDEALLHDADDVGDPSVRRIPVDPPYASAKATLLTVVADANRCRAVFTEECGWVTVFGYAGDLDAVELLATSLLAQATAAMARHGSRRDATGRSRTRSFRRSFLLGFAGRIGERLRATTESQVAATDSARLLPVLAARDDRLDAAVAEAFPQIERRSGSVSHGGGFAAGRTAADLADLTLKAGAIDDVRAS